MATEYAKAIWPDRYRACGRRLQAHTLGHALLLQRLGCAFAMGSDQEPGPGDLFLAAFVCSRPWRRAARQCDAWWYSLWVAAVVLLRRGWLMQDLVTMSSYFATAWASPRTWESSGNLRGTDLVQILVVGQRTRFGKSLGEALDTTVQEAVLDHMEWLESQNALRIWSPDDEAMRRKLEEIEAEDRRAAAASNETTTVTA